MKQLVFLLLSLLLSLPTYARPLASGPFEISGCSELTARKSCKLDLTALPYTRIYYNIHCVIENKNSAASKFPAVIKINGDNNIQAFIDKKPMPHLQGALFNLLNDLTITNLYYFTDVPASTIYIQNLDDTDSITIKNCYAEYMT